MVWTRPFCVLGCAVLLWTGCSERKDVVTPAGGHPLPTEAQPTLVKRKLYVGPVELEAEIAVRPRELETGMMFRTNVVDGDAMLFVFRQPQQVGFWMMNCPTPLSSAYVNPEGIIEEIHDMEPFNTNSIVSHSYNILFVLETARGWFERNNVQTGMLIRAESGSLIETFFRPRAP